MVRKWPKSGQKWPKLPQNRRNNWRGSPRKSQRIPKISEKRSKTLPLKYENAPKKVKMAKNRQKMAKIIRKIDFLYNNFPEKVISLRKCTKFFRACGANFGHVWRPPARGGGSKNFPPHSHTSLYRSLIPTLFTKGSLAHLDTMRRGPGRPPHFSQPPARAWCAIVF